MSGEKRRAGAPQGPPWPPDLLADLHAGVLDPEEADELRRQVGDDAEANAILTALDAVGQDLADLPEPAMPPEVAARLDAVLDAEARGRAQQQDDGSTLRAADTAPAQSNDRESRLHDSATDSAAVGNTATYRADTGHAAGGDASGAEVIDLAAARKKRRRWWAASSGLLAAAALTGVVVLATMPGDQGEQAADPPGRSAPPAAQSSPPLALSGGELGEQQFDEVFGADQLGALSDPEKLVGCLQANGIDSGKPLGARTVTVDGRPGQTLVLPAGEIGEFRILTVGPECGPGNPATISDTTFGG
ncbi:hypothetical protein [Parasphingorhabdus pacifica]